MKAKVSILTREFAKALAVSTKLINRKNALPILGDSLLRYNDRGQFTLTSSNSDAWLQLPLPQMTCNEYYDDNDRLMNAKPFAVGLHSAELLSAIQSLPDMLLQIWLDFEKQTMRVEYFTGGGEQDKGGRFEMPFDLADDYPQAPALDKPDLTLKADGKTLLPLIRSARLATANDELRPQMSCVCLDIRQDEYAVVGSDDHMLIADRVNFGVGTGVLTGQPQVLLLHKSIVDTLQTAFSTQDALTVKATPQVVAIESGDTVLTVRSVEQRYPNWQSVIPKDSKHETAVFKGALIAALKRVQLFASDSSNMVRLQFEGDVLTVSGQDYDFSKTAEERVSLQSSTVPDGFAIGVKASTLLDVLSTVRTENVILHLTDAARAIVLREEDQQSLYQSLCMPMLLNDNPA